MNLSWKRHKRADGRFDRKNVTNQHFYEESLNQKISWDFFNEFWERGNTRSCFSMLVLCEIKVGSMLAHPLLGHKPAKHQTSWAPSAGARTAGGSPFPGSCKEHAMLVFIHSMIPWVWTIPKPWVCMNSSWKLHNWADGRFDRKTVTNQHFYEESLNKKMSWAFQSFLGRVKHDMLFINSQCWATCYQVGSMLANPFLGHEPKVLSIIGWGKNSLTFRFSRLLQGTGYVRNTL